MKIEEFTPEKSQEQKLLLIRNRQVKQKVLLQQ